MKLLSRQVLSLAYMWCLSSSVLSFFMLVVPVLMRQQEFELTTIGMIYALATPQLFKWLWGPLIDRYSPAGKAESGWLAITLLVSTCALAAIAFLDLKNHFWLIYGLMMLCSLTSNLLTILCCSMVVKRFDQGQQNWLNGVMVSTMSIGMVLGGGLLLYLYEWLEWQGCLFVFAACCAFGLLLLPKVVQDQQLSSQVPYKRVWTLFKKPGIRRWAVVMMLFYGANQGVYAMIKPFLVDIGISNQSIALLTGLFSSLVGVVAGLLGSVMVKRLGARHSLNSLALLLTVSVVLFIQVEGSESPLLWLYPACGFLMFAVFAAFTVLCVVSMSYCDKETAATDFSVLTVLPYLGAMPFATMSGWVTEKIGYQNFFMLSALISLASMVLIYWVYRDHQPIDLSKPETRSEPTAHNSL